ncbi:MAG: SDR family oxidoreductase [Bdellovibrionaceae bacterium]|nr:SDR family oxidoreductase [Pseudobdellovibrionaceae bacterium]NUM59467.1 SDR family oxidoreductase [Pseudobdellovibrionaceae bacterium]
MENIRKKTVFITGISSGFGYLVTKMLLEKDYLVVGALRGGESRGKEIFAEQMDKINNKSLLFIDTHLDQTTSLNFCIEQVSQLLSGGIDILINNAGYGLLGPIEIQEETQIRLQFETNFFAPLFLIKKLLPLIRKRQGRILNLSSLVGFNVFPFYGTYSASKHAIESITEALYYELSEFNVQICAIEPGGFRTNFSASSKMGLLDHPEHRMYEKRIKRFNKFLNYVQEKIEKDPVIVTKKIIELCEAKKIPVRVRVGFEAHFNWILKKIMPDQLRIKIQDWLYKTFFF